MEERIIKTESDKDKLNVKLMFEVFKRKTESDVAFREFSNALEIHGFTKSILAGRVIIRKIKLKPDSDEPDFID